MEDFLRELLTSLPSLLEFVCEDEEAKAEKAAFEPRELMSDRIAEVFCFFCTFEVELGADFRPAVDDSFSSSGLIIT